MHLVVTCGPSYEPIDAVRRITNFSTGELGILLANTLQNAGHSVTCLRGVSATCPLSPVAGVRVLPFTTNADLLSQLQALARAGGVDAVFHAAALCDYQVRQVALETGEHLPAAQKIPSRSGSLVLTLEPALKILSTLRELFPGSRIVGWKYELEGGRAAALGKAFAQIAENATTAAIVNGAAYGAGFGWCQAGALRAHWPDKTALCEALAHWLKGPASEFPLP
jgi:phosphopantothenoylcysteine synthetase/decarboxylase